MRYIKAKRRRSHAYDHLYEFGTQATIAKYDHQSGWWVVFFDSDLRWCNMYGFEVRRCNNDPKILGDEDGPTK